VDDKDGLQAKLVSHVSALLESNVELLAKAAAQPNFKQRMQEAMFFAYSENMRACGPEFNLLGSLKVTFSGSRHVIVAAFDDVKKALLSVSAKGTVISLPLIRDFLSGADATRLAMISGRDLRGGVFAGVVPPESMLYIPAGYLVAEETTNGQDVVGIRFMIPPPKDGVSRESWTSLMRAVRPGGVGTPAAQNCAFAAEIEDYMNNGGAKAEDIMFG
jgi:hypothetical protein